MHPYALIGVLAVCSLSIAAAMYAACATADLIARRIAGRNQP